MRKIAIVGAGQAGLQLSLCLLEAGYDVTLYSEHNAQQTLNRKLFSFAFLWGTCIELEQKMGVEQWLGKAPLVKGLQLTLNNLQGDKIGETKVAYDQPGLGVDQRLKYALWIDTYLAKGGKFVHKEVNIDDVEQYASENDLVIMATGKGDLKELFEKDEAKCVYKQPQRNIVGFAFKNYHDADNPGNFTKNDIVPLLGEIYSMSFYHKDFKEIQCMGIHTTIGGPWDHLKEVQSGEELMVEVKKILKKHTPWQYDLYENITLASEKDWLAGGFTPTVRKPVATLPSGKKVLGIGDTIVLNDPISAQGANNATRMAYYYFNSIVANTTKSFDEAWMQNTFQQFWHDYQYVNILSNAVLNPKAHQRKLLGVALQNKMVAHDIVNGFGEPKNIFPWYGEAKAAKAYLKDKQFSSWQLMKDNLKLVKSIIEYKIFG